MSRRAAIYLRPAPEPRQPLLAWLRTDGFREWPALPDGYPAGPEEVRELVVRAPVAADGWAMVVPEAFENVFRFALEIAARAPGVAVLAATDRWDGRVCAKLYRESRVLLKVGDDRDDELTYLVPRSEPDAFAEAARALGLPAAATAALTGWGRRLGAGEAPDLEALALAFALPEPPARFRERRPAADGPGPWERLLFVHRTSPLIVNA
jgi:hypothetical protein